MLADHRDDPRSDLDHPDHYEWTKEREALLDSGETDRWISEQRVKYEQQQREERDPNENREVDSTYPEPASVKRVRDFLNRKRKTELSPAHPATILPER